MYRPVARLGDGSTHGGQIISASGGATANDIPIAVDGDSHSCPIPGHGITPISAIANDTSANGRRVLTVGAVAGCGAVINTGSPDVTAQ